MTLEFALPVREGFGADNSRTLHLIFFIDLRLLGFLQLLFG